jgi:hypothetical protein
MSDGSEYLILSTVYQLAATIRTRPISTAVVNDVE